MQTLEALGHDGRLTALRLKDHRTDAVSEMPFDGVFVQIGLSANSALFREAVETNRAGEISVDRNCRTALRGFYAAGDVTDVAYKQIVIAMGEGAKAALSAFEDRIRGRL